MGEADGRRPPPLRPGLLDEVLDATRAEPSPPRSVVRRRAWGLVALSAALAVGVFALYGGLRDGGAPRPASVIAATTLGAAGIAAIGLWLATGQRSMLSRSAGVLGATAVGVPVALLAWKLGWSATVAGGLDPWSGRVGWPCLQIGLATGLTPALALLLVRRRSEPRHPRLLGAALGAVAGAFAWGVTDLWCPVGHVPHLLLGHVLPVVVFIGLGALLGGACLAVRWSPAR